MRFGPLLLAAVVVLGAAVAPARAQSAAPLSVRQAIERSLQQGPTAALGRLDYASARTSNDAALATMFAPTATTNVSYGKVRTRDTFGVTQVTRSGIVGVSSTLHTRIGADVIAEVSRPVVGYDSVSNGSVATLGVNIPLLKGAGLQAATLDYRQLQLVQRANERNLEAVRLAAVSDAFNAYYVLYEAIQQRGLADATLARAQDNGRISQALVQAGRIARIDTLQAQADVSRAALDQETARVAEADAQRALALVLGDAPTATYQIPTELQEPPPQAPNVDDALTTAYAARLELADAIDALASRGLSSDKAHNDLLPQLDFSARIDRGIGPAGTIPTDGSPVQPARPQTTSLGLVLQIPLTRTDLNAARRVADIGVDRARRQLEETRKSIQSSVQSALDNLQAARRSLELARKTLTLQSARLGAEVEKFKSGRSNNSLVSIAQDALRDAELAELGGRVALIRRQFDLDVAQGQALRLWAPAVGAR